MVGGGNERVPVLAELFMSDLQQSQHHQHQLSSVSGALADPNHLQRLVGGHEENLLRVLSFLYSGQQEKIQGTQSDPSNGQQ